MTRVIQTTHPRIAHLTGMRINSSRTIDLPEFTLQFGKSHTHLTRSARCARVSQPKTQYQPILRQALDSVLINGSCLCNTVILCRLAQVHIVDIVHICRLYRLNKSVNQSINQSNLTLVARL